MLITMSTMIPMVNCSSIGKRSIWDMFRARIAKLLNDRTTTQPPVTTTQPPVTTTQPPVTTTQAPVSTTQAPTQPQPTQSTTTQVPSSLPTDEAQTPNCGTVNCEGDTPVCCPCDSGNNTCTRIGFMCIRSDSC